MAHGISTVTLTDKEVKLVKELLMPSVDSITDDTSSRLYEKLVAAAEAGRVGYAVHFINIYRVTKVTGGNEEGGWEYPCYECVDTIACESIDTAIQEFRDVTGMFIDESRLFCYEEVWPVPSTELLERWERSGEDDSTRKLYLSDNRTIVAIEQAPGMQATIERLKYE